jgi:hypothetical protein
MPAAELADALLAADGAGRAQLVSQAEAADLQAAIDALGHSHEAAAAEVLSLVDAVSTDRALRKAARRELHRLRSSGIQAPPAAEAPPAPAATGHVEPTVAVSEAWATDIDPSGARAVWLLGDRPLGGAWFAALLLNDLKGVLELSLVDTTRKRFQRELAERRREPGAWVKLPGDYAWRLVREAVDVGREQGTALPTRYRALREVFGEAPGPPERALVHETVSPAEAGFNPDWLDESQSLVREPEVTGWHIPVPDALRARALEVARAQSSTLLVPGNTPEQQALHLLADAGREALTPPLVRAIRRRLEETAYIFAVTDRLTAARRAVAAARALEDGHRPDRNPFVRVLLEAGLARALRADQVNGRPAPEVLLELIERSVENAREGGRGGVESRPSGLILPR